MRVSVPGMSRRKPSGIHVRTLHARVKLLTAGLVAIAVIVSASAVYIVFNAYLQGNVDRQLERTSDAITDTVNFGGVTPVLGLTAGADTAVIQAVGLLTADGALVTATPGLPPFSTSAGRHQVDRRRQFVADNRDRRCVSNSCRALGCGPDFGCRAIPGADAFGTQATGSGVGGTRGGRNRP